MRTTPLPCSYCFGIVLIFAGCSQIRRNTRQPAPPDSQPSGRTVPHTGTSTPCTGRPIRSGPPSGRISFSDKTLSGRWSLKRPWNNNRRPEGRGPQHRKGQEHAYRHPEGRNCSRWSMQGEAGARSMCLPNCRPPAGIHDRRILHEVEPGNQLPGSWTSSAASGAWKSPGAGSSTWPRSRPGGACTDKRSWLKWPRAYLALAADRENLANWRRSTGDGPGGKSSTCHTGAAMKWGSPPSSTWRQRTDPRQRGFRWIWPVLHKAGGSG